jgi:hypothetical protein
MPRPTNKSNRDRSQIPDAVKITKLQAIEDQLSAAVTIYFSGKTDIAVTTLAFAAHECLRSIARGIAPGAVTFDLEAPARLAQGTNAAELKAEVTACYKFFKHGGSNPHEEHYFLPKMTELILLDGIKTYETVAKKTCAEFRCFLMWMCIWYPGILQNATPEGIKEAEQFRKNPQSRQEFFASQFFSVCEALNRELKPAPL